MNAARFLSHLRSIGAEVEVSQGRLRVTMARGQLTEELKSEIAAQKGELLALLTHDPENDEVPALAPGAPRPLSLFQERLWFMYRWQPESTAYNMAAHWLSDGPVEVAAVVDAIVALAERHETLRSCFRENDGVPEAVVLAGVPVEVRDLRAKTAAEQRSTFEAERARELHRPFDLGKEAPSRFIVYRVTDDRVLTLLVAHHIAVDAWSMGLVGSYVTAAYAGTPLPAAPTRSYADYAAWQRSKLDADALKTDLDWWQSYLAGSPALSTLPSNRPRLTSPRGATREFRFDRALSEGVRSLARQSRVTVYMALTSALAAALHWYSGQERLLLGSPMGLRERPEFERMIGPFVNVLVLKLDLANDPTFSELLVRARGAVLDAHAHRDVPFERLVQRLKPAPAPGHAPLFQAAVVLHNGPDAVAIESGGALFDLSWFVREVDGEFVGGLEYRTDAYEDAAIGELIARLEAILRAAVKNPEERLASLPRLSEGERPPAQKPRDGAPGAANQATSLLADFARELEAGTLLAFTERRPEGASGRKTYSLDFSEVRRAALARTATASNASPSAVLCAAFVAFAHRYGGQTEFYAPLLADAPGSPGVPVLFGFR
ncbi:MAG TPA: condensation domain-containing protein, partial [Polyangiaceae bacterium]|nr:condensation domain-containing protein [Polyangiaceae bacterium]